MDMRAAVTNVQVGDDIGLDHTTVSRIRTGTRLPSIDVMVDIARVYGWNVEKQIEARMEDRYQERFEFCLVSRFGVDDLAHATP